ncbi:polysaccharide deacetylase family protein [Asaia prunellae]|uniref:polysaccharide deacetylase family protein n=1 Tax=Asaia prunellae TaxID=610245 RepID=UPI0004714B33|nr:polysaccharide deacetylase family protein [Asaia prunellae]
MTKKTAMVRRGVIPFARLSLIGFFPIAVHVSAQPVHLVAVTFDDLPYVMSDKASRSDNQKDAQPANRAILAALRHDAVPVTAFVNEDKVRALGSLGTKILTQWNQGTLTLANHAAHHVDSNMLTPAQFENEIKEGERSIGPLAHKAGRKLEFFRFPFNHVGDTEPKRKALSEIVRRLGYRQAATTIDVEDYLFNDAYECAHAAGNPVDEQRILQAYIDYARIEIPCYQKLDEKIMGYDVPAVMLLHSNRLNAVALPQILALFREQHYRFVTLTQAQSDPAFKREPAIATRFGPMWGYRWAKERHIPVDGRLEQEPPDWVRNYCHKL